ncbi:hypothetical protein NL676_007516 [Syzygium grande]|nr:hypothetical protein NL676_007516 [Syzygium grande]
MVRTKRMRQTTTDKADNASMSPPLPTPFMSWAYSAEDRVRKRCHPRAHKVPQDNHMARVLANFDKNRFSVVNHCPYIFTSRAIKGATKAHQSNAYGALFGENHGDD